MSKAAVVSVGQYTESKRKNQYFTSLGW